ncbi:conserved hypothetical protein [Vibrio crassostreae]|nr:conserved hypothetical protein [Vibrio crassostreae]CAK2721551.1 conserved hypothetical protein [Vibrio crassostreae]CAK3880791.1 conserved hypothetical protein [Vibrio crassostreae]
MAVSPSDILTCTENQLNQATTESEYRNIVSRSYYSMYHSALTILAHEPPSYGGQGVHSSLISYLQSNDVKTSEVHSPSTLKALSYMLQQYKAQRVIADYYLTQNITKDNASDSVNTAKRFKQKCDEITPQQTSDK